jgi:hypothetical protein
VEYTLDNHVGHPLSLSSGNARQETAAGIPSISIFSALNFNKADSRQQPVAIATTQSGSRFNLFSAREAPAISEKLDE